MFEGNLCPKQSSSNVGPACEVASLSGQTSTRTGGATSSVSITLGRMNNMDLGELLSAVREAVREELRAQSAAPLKPLTLRYAKAAALLDVSPSKVKLLVRAGAIQTVRVGGRPMIPMSEVERLAVPTIPKRAARARASVTTVRHNGKAEAAAFRAALKKR